MSNIRLVNFAEFNDRDEKLVLAGNKGVFVFDFIYKSKYEPQLAASIDQEGKHINIKLGNTNPVENCDKLLWCKGLRLDHHNEFIISWNANYLCFHYLRGLNPGKLRFMVKDLVSPEVEITDLRINMEYRYFYNATSTGPIHVWKFDNSKKQIHTFHGHFKEVSCLTPLNSEPDLFVSASLDTTVRIWSLDKFQQLYQLSFNQNFFNFVRVYDNGQRILTSQGDMVVVNKMHLILKNYLATDSDILSLQPGFDNEENFNNFKIDFTVSLGSDNSAFIQRPLNNFKCTLFPPPSA
jgi:WD40 repeat protein